MDTGGTDPDVTIALAPGNNAVTHLDIDFTSRTASKITFTVTQSSDIDTRKPGEATFSNFRIRPTTGVLPNSGIITNTGSTAPGGTTNYGDLGMVEGAPAKIRVETESDGTGQVVPTQNITAGTSLTVYAISRDQYNNFLENMAADEWSLQNKSSLDTSPLTPSNDSTYVVFQSDTTGAAEIRATKSGLTSTDSGTITVQPASTATAGEDFVQQPVVDVQDEYGNRVTTDNATVITASRGKGSGVLQGTTELLVRQGRATFTNLKHQVANTINIDFNSSGFPKVTSTDIVVGPATPAKLLFSRQLPNGAKDDPLDPGPVVQIADEFGNYTSNPNTTIDILIDSGPGGGTVSGTTSLLADSSAIFSDLKFNITSPVNIYDEYSHLVQIGSFKNRQNAENVKSVAENQFNLPFSIIYNLKRGLYAVRSPAVQNRTQAMSLLFSISENQPDEAALVFTGNSNTNHTPYHRDTKIQIGAFTTRSRAVRHARLSRIKLDLPTSVRYDSTENLFNVYINQAEQNGALKQQLNIIRRKEYFSDAFIENTPVSSQGITESENVDFLYQIHVKGVSETSRQIYLNQITDNNTDAYVSDEKIKAGPEEEWIIYKNLTDWNKTLELKQKLDRILSETERAFIGLIKKP